MLELVLRHSTLKRQDRDARRDPRRDGHASARWCSNTSSTAALYSRGPFPPVAKARDLIRFTSDCVFGWQMSAVH
eukprot:scaffold1591_cov456-Prasinococcus_capsulatus_cf.AAC.1